ncbi:hypothetical protein BDZ45DRAFT_606787, partial [Acephala macrosclerotiorum]
EMKERERWREDLGICASNAHLGRQEAEEKLCKAREKGDRKRKEEAQAQKKFRDVGVCAV